VSLPPPPRSADDLVGFPRPEPPVGPGKPPLWRIFLHRDPQTGQVRQPFYFASAPAGAAPGGRYDLPAPDGACYLALSGIGAWLEVFRGTRLVARDDLRRRRLLTTRPPRRVAAADLLAKRATGFGITGDIHTCDDYSLTRAWATRLHQAGFRALLGKVRHDPGLHERSLTLLDRAGQHAPYDWRWHEHITPLTEDGELIAVAQAYGYRVLDPPHDVVTED
jgi:hypothetical protein